MADEDRLDGADSHVTVQLLDPSWDRAVKTWKFQDVVSISIGREQGQDVEVGDPYVSRNHAELVWRDSRWLLVSRGRHGVLVENRMISELAFDGPITFRLGPNGPTLRFQPSPVADPGTQTMSFDQVPQELFRLDSTKVKDEVDEITRGAYFQNLKEKARQLRGGRESR
jgi:pSer/pThr/pTyr-binding forkhead associated (FHA) protein